MQEKNEMKRFMEDIGFFDQNEVDKAEVKDRTKIVEEMKSFLEKHNIESARVILTNCINRMLTEQAIEFKIKIKEDEPNMFTHFYHSLHEKQKDMAKEIAYEIANEVFKGFDYSLFIKQDKSSADNDISFVPKDLKGKDFEQGDIYYDKDGNHYFIMGWDKHRMYFLYNPPKDTLMADLLTKSLPHEDFKQKF